jgi:peptidoglycan/LPS O-acetylase OafA/YrhL
MSPQRKGDNDVVNQYGWKLCGRSLCLMNSTKRLSSLDGLRGIAAVAVMIFHFDVFFLPQAHLPFVIGRAYLAVDLFFLLSGFVMVHVYGSALASDRRAHWLQFAIARFARIYPLFALTTLAMVTIVSVSGANLGSISFSERALALEPLLLQQWTGLSWDYPSWSISTEAEAYLFFIFTAGLLVRGKHPWLTALGCAAILAGLDLAQDGRLNFLSGSPALLRTLAEFSIGALLYRLHASHLRFRYLTLLCMGLAAITRQDFFVVIAFACLIYYAVDATDALTKLLNSRPLVALGNWSYSIYLWHVPTHCAVMAAFKAIGHPVQDLSLSSARLLLVATAVTVVGISAFSYRCFEDPMRRALVLRYSGIRQLSFGPDHQTASGRSSTPRGSPGSRSLLTGRKLVGSFQSHGLGRLSAIGNSANPRKK